MLEGFEDDAAWGVVRGTTAPSITSSGVTWTANNAASGVTTGGGPARSGQWGFYTLLHGSYASGVNCDLPGNCGDGFIGASAGTFVAVGGWVEGSLGAKLEVSLDGDLANPVDFGEVCDPQGQSCVDPTILGSQHRFFGVIETAGFIEFQLREMEETAGDQEFIFADDFTFAFTDGPASCGNGVLEAGEQCDDGNTLDGDGCTSICQIEECNDGIDNDGDGKMDYDAALSRYGVADAAGPDPTCVNSYDNRESPCGLGAELTLLLPPLMWLRRRRPFGRIGEASVSHSGKSDLP